MNVWHICIVNHLWKKVKRFYSLYGPSLGMICTKQGASIQAIHSHVSVSALSSITPSSRKEIASDICLTQTTRKKVRDLNTNWQTCIQWTTVCISAIKSPRWTHTEVVNTSVLTIYMQPRRTVLSQNQFIFLMKLFGAMPLAPRKNTVL